MEPYESVSQEQPSIEEANPEVQNQDRLSFLKELRHPARAIGNLLLPAAVKLQILANDASEMLTPLRQDIAEKPGIERVNTALKVGSVGVLVAVNAMQLRNAATPFVLDLAHNTGPIAGPVVAGAAGATLHAGWFGLYSHTLRKGTEALPHTISATGERLHADKLKLPGLAPGSTEAPEDVTGRLERFKERFKRRSKRAVVMQGTSTLAYVVGAAGQGQSPEDLKKLCNETSVEGAAGAFMRSMAFAGAVALVGVVDESAAKSFLNFSNSFEGIATMTAVPLSIGGLYLAIKRRLQNRHEFEDYVKVPSR